MPNLLLFLALALPALTPAWALPSTAEAPPEPGVPPGPDVIPSAPVQELPLVPLAGTRVWEEVGSPSPRSETVSLSVSPEAANRWLAADAAGAVFLTDDAGARWMEVIPGTEDDAINDERLLLQAEMLSADSIQGVSETDAEDPEYGIAGDAAEAVREANETTSAVLQARAGAALPPTVWFDRAGGGIALVGRAGEVWRSADGGETWLRVDGEAGATAFARVGSVVVAGGEDGVRASLDDGVSWVDVDSALVGRRIVELAAFGGTLYAATDNGLFWSFDALHWSRLEAAPDGPLVSTIPDPDFPGGFWVAAERGLFRTDDGGRSFAPALNQPLRGLRRMVHLDEPGHLLAISSDGVWESMDAGLKWVPASRLLSDPDVRALDFSSGMPVIATATGIWRMVQPEQLTDLEVQHKPVMSLGATVDLAVSRAGLRGDLLAMAKKTRALPFIPNLTLSASAGLGGSRDADFQVLATSGARGIDWAANAQLCWGGCSSSTSYYSYDSDSFDVEQMIDDGALTVIDGEVYDEGSVVAAAANVAQALQSFRLSTAQQVGKAWMSRQRLVAEGPSLASAPLRDRVMHELAVEELDARLDAWTEGRFTTWKPESP